MVYPPRIPCLLHLVPLEEQGRGSTELLFLQRASSHQCFKRSSRKLAYQRAHTIHLPLPVSLWRTNIGPKHFFSFAGDGIGGLDWSTPAHTLRRVYLPKQAKNSTQSVVPLVHVARCISVLFSRNLPSNEMKFELLFLDTVDPSLGRLDYASLSQQALM